MTTTLEKENLKAIRSFQMSRELYEAIQEASDNEHLSCSQFMRRALRRELARTRPEAE